MPITELYSTRNKSRYPDVFQYQWVSNKLTQQIIQILTDCIGTHENYSLGKTNAKQVYEYLYTTLRKEYGVRGFAGYQEGSVNWLVSYLEHEVQTTEEFLDVLELACQIIDTFVRNEWGNFKGNCGSIQEPDSALSEINERMKRDGFGYEFTNGIVVRIDEQYIHAEVVKPALLILQDFKGAQEEFLSAHEHYRHGKFEECITDCCKSFESLMKAICHEQGWIDDKEHDKLPAAKLIQKCIENELVPVYMQNQFTAFKQLLESGVPTVRNKTAGHGTGKEVREIPQGLVSYTLHLTATNIVFLGNCYHEMK